MSINIGIGESQRKAVSRILAATLADASVLYVKTRNFHWNVTGPHFNDLHKLLESQYDALAESIDEIAERIRALGEVSPGSMAQFLQLARIKEHTGAPPAWRDMLAALLADHEAIIRTLRSDLDACATQHGDAGTQDFLTGLMESHEKTAWMLRAFQEG